MFQVLLVYLFVLVIVFHFFFYHKYHFPNYVREIEKIPGPKGMFFFGHIPRFYQIKIEDILPYMKEEFKTWGSTFKYWYSGVAVVLVSDVDDVQTILSCKSGQEKGLVYDYLRPWLGSGLLTSAGEKWKMMRKIITPTFHFSILRDYIHIFVKNSKIMMNLLDQEKNKDECDLAGFITYCALDSIGETSMGKCMNSQITKSEDKYVRAIFQFGKIVVKRMFSPFLYTNHIFMLSSTGRENSNVLRILHGVTTKLIQERKQRHLTGNLDYDEDEESGRKRIPFLDLLLEKQKEFHFSDTDLREEVDTVLMAGHDTTSTALTWCFFELGLREDIQEKVYEELQSIFEGSDRDPTYQDLSSMEYLKRVLQETLRLYPSAPVISRKFHCDIQLKNHLVPANTDIILMLYHIHRDPGVYSDPENFDPDRFLPEAVLSRNPFAYVPFSAGPRNCLGQKYAMLQMLVMASYILRKYKIKTLNRRESVKPMPEVILRPNVQLKWKLTPRT